MSPQAIAVRTSASTAVTVVANQSAREVTSPRSAARGIHDIIPAGWQADQGALPPRSGGGGTPIRRAQGGRARHADETRQITR